MNLLKSGVQMPVAQGQVLCSEYFFDVDREYFNSQENFDDQNEYFAKQEFKDKENEIYGDFTQNGETDEKEILEEEQVPSKTSIDDIVQSYLEEGIVTIICDEEITKEKTNDFESSNFCESQYTEDEIIEIMLSKASTVKSENIKNSNLIESDLMNHYSNDVKHEMPKNLEGKFKKTKEPNNEIISFEISPVNSYVRRVN